MDAPKHGWLRVHTQEHMKTMKGKDIKSFLIMYISSAFVGPQKNLATLQKGAYAIYMEFKKLSYYLYHAKVTIKSDHNTLCKFLTQFKRK